MIVSIGVDTADVERFAKLLAKNRQHLYKTLFCAEELAILPTFSGPREKNYLAGRWAAKEAVLKVLGTGIGPVTMPEVGVFAEPSGKPSIKLFGNALLEAEKLNINRWHLSITHERGLATAFVIGESI